jgi:hypothetical protein
MAITKLNFWMTLTHTIPQLRTAILEGLSYWHDPTQAHQPSRLHDIQLAIGLQDSIG